MFGESHDHHAAKEFATSLLLDLRSRGYSIAAVELESSFQKNVDAFLAGKITGEQLEKAVPYLENS